MFVVVRPCGTMSAHQHAAVPIARPRAWLTLRACVSGLEARRLPPLKHARKLLQGALLRVW